MEKLLKCSNQTPSAVCHHQMASSDGKQPKTLDSNILIIFFNNFLSWYIKYPLLSEHHGNSPHNSPFLIGEAVHSRTNEVLQCINLLEERGQSTAISFLIHSFEEVISLFSSM